MNWRAARYLLPCIVLVLLVQVAPVLYTVAVAFTNASASNDLSKAAAIKRIEATSIRPVPGSPSYPLTVLDGGDHGRLAFLLTDEHGHHWLGTAAGLRALAGPGVPAGYVELSLAQAQARIEEVAALRVPARGDLIGVWGDPGQAVVMTQTRAYDRARDVIVDTADPNRTWYADAKAGQFVNRSGPLSPGWRVGVGWRNLVRVLTDPHVNRPFVGVLAWNLVFAGASVATQFALGLACALALDGRRGRAHRWYRILIVLPYAMPSFAMLRVWRDLLNRDEGLLNHLTGLHVDWWGSTWTARIAVVVVQMWLGYPYMFLVTTAALRAIPTDVVEAARVEGASAYQCLWRIRLPLLLGSVAPLLVLSFAFNFNNFNAINLTTDGGPFGGNPDAGATDLLVTYTYRMAFDSQGADLGFVSAVSVYVFVIVAAISLLTLRYTRRWAA
jgi:ABC-type sugar transport system permease subunit